MTRPPLVLPALGPRQQLHAGRTVRRLVQLYAGLALYGWSMAMMLRGGLGLAPWDVLNEGLATRLPLSYGEITMVIGVLVLLLWIPLRQWPGLGTVSNVVVIGITVDVGLAVLPAPEPLAARMALMVGGVVLNGLAGAAYVGSWFGAGPRDGLMTGLVTRTGRSVRLVRTSIEVVVLALGWLLGGTVGIGTVLYAVGIGPLVQFFLPWVAVRLPDVSPTRPRPRVAAPAGRPGNG